MEGDEGICVDKGSEKMSGGVIDPVRRWCDNCGREVIKMHRIHKGKGYCSSCYATEFVQVPCAKCPEMARMHRRDVSVPLCGGCQRAGRACARCGKAVPKAGKRLDGEAVACPSCAPYFREKEPCSSCGRLSSKLTWRGEGDLIWRVCEPCRIESSHATCVHCRRHRAVAGTSEAGAPYCIDCGPLGLTWHSCPGCGVSVAGKGRGRCRSCLNHDRLRHDARFVAATLSGSWSVELLNDFVSWLLEHDGGNPKLPAIMLSHAPFFASLDSAFDSPGRLGPQTMLDTFAVQGLRRHILPVRFLGERIGLEINAEAKAEHVESARIMAIIDAAEARGCSEDLVCFNQWMIQDLRPTRTRRLYMSAAARLIEAAGGVRLSKLDQDAVDRYLAKFPGRRNDVGPVLRFSRAVLGSETCLPPLSKPRVQQPKPVLQLRALLKKAEAAGDAAPLDLLERIIAVAMHIPPRDIRAGRWWPERRGRKWLVVSQTDSVASPPELHAIIERWKATRR